MDSGLAASRRSGMTSVSARTLEFQSAAHARACRIQRDVAWRAELEILDFSTHKEVAGQRVIEAERGREAKRVFPVRRLGRDVCPADRGGHRSADRNFGSGRRVGLGVGDRARGCGGDACSDVVGKYGLCRIDPSDGQPDRDIGEEVVIGPAAADPSRAVVAKRRARGVLGGYRTRYVEDRRGDGKPRMTLSFRSGSAKRAAGDESDNASQSLSAA